MLSPIMASALLCAFSAEIAEESAPDRLIILLRIVLSGGDADDVARADGNSVHGKRRGAGGGIDAGHGAGDRCVFDDGVANRVGRRHGDRVLAVGKLLAARILAVPGERVRALVASTGAGED